MVIGITGGIGSGKSTVVKMFAELGNIAVYYADDEAKKLINTSSEIREKLTKEFTEEAFINNQLNRPFIANIVFNDKQKLTVLNAIVHPVVKKHLINFIEEHQNKDYILYENAILFENGSDAICDKIITVTAPKNIKIERVVKRDKVTKEAVESRMKNQWSDEKKVFLSNYVIKNTEKTATKEQVLHIHKNITKTK